MNRGEWQDLFNWAVDDVWPNHLDQDIPEWRQRVEALAIAAEFYMKRRAEGNDHENAKHRVFEDIMRLAGRGPVTPPVTGRRLVGPLRHKNGATYGFFDDAGPVVPIVVSHLDAFPQWAMHDKERVRRQWREHVANGVHGIRAFINTAGAFFEHRPYPGPGRDLTLTPLTSGFYALYELFLADLIAHDLRLCHAVASLDTNAGLGATSARHEHMRRLAEIHHRVGLEHILVMEVNEPPGIGEHEPDRVIAMMDVYRAATNNRVLTANGSYYGPESKKTTNLWSRHAHLWQYHHQRTGTSVDRTRHKWNHPYPENNEHLDLVMGYDSEHTGRGWPISVGQEPHPEAIVGLGIAAVASRQLTVYFGDGVVLYSHTGEFTDNPAYAALCARLRELQELIPDVYTFTERAHGGPGRSNLFEITKGSRETRVDQLIGPKAALTYAYDENPSGGTSTIRIRQERHSTRTLVIHPVTGERTELQLAKGQEFEVTFERGRMLVSTWS